MLVISIVIFLFSYVFFVKKSLWLGSYIKRRVCAFCFASAVVVIFLSLGQVFNIQYSLALLSLFMMQSGIGIAFLADEFLMNHRLPFSYDVLKITIAMTSIISSYLVFQWSFIIGITLFLPVLLFGFFALSPVVTTKNSKKTVLIISEHERNMIEERLKKCC